MTQPLAKVRGSASAASTPRISCGAVMAADCTPPTPRSTPTSGAAALPSPHVDAFFSIMVAKTALQLGWHSLCDLNAFVVCLPAGKIAKPGVLADSVEGTSDMTLQGAVLQWEAVLQGRRGAHQCASLMQVHSQHGQMEACHAACMLCEPVLARPAAQQRESVTQPRQ